MSSTDFTWLIGGPQGSGVESGANIFSRVCAEMGYQIFGKREFYSNIKGEHSYFTVRIAISIQSFKDLSLLKENLIETGIYRAKYKKIEHEKEYQPTWITWVNPNTNKPNFHIKSSFGILELDGFI